MKKQTSVSVDENFLREANKVFGTLGISLSEAVNLFLEKVSVEKNIPFELNSPSDELLK